MSKNKKNKTKAKSKFTATALTFHKGKIGSNQFDFLKGDEVKVSESEYKTLREAGMVE